MTYDSRPVTQAHIIRVGDLMQHVINLLTMRAMVHDQSKFQEPEKSALDLVGPPGHLTYSKDGFVTPEYQRSLDALAVMREHHYAVNTHHPEHWINGINDMSLLDILEMLCDWKAAGEIYKDGNIVASLETNAERFNISPQLAAVMVNTAKELGWL